MRRLLPVLVAVLLVAACGGDREPPSVGDVGAGADEPIPVEPDGGIGGEAPPLDEAPPFGVSSEVGSAVVEPTSACWMPETGGPGVCFDGEERPEDHVLGVDEELVVTYVAGDLNFSVGPTADADAGPGTDLPFEIEADGLWRVSTADLEPGEHVLHLFWQGEQGDSSAALTLRVE